MPESSRDAGLQHHRFKRGRSPSLPIGIPCSRKNAHPSWPAWTARPTSGEWPIEGRVADRAVGSEPHDSTQNIYALGRHRVRHQLTAGPAVQLPKRVSTRGGSCPTLRSACRRAGGNSFPKEEVASGERNDGLAALLVQAVGGQLTFLESGHRRIRGAVKTESSVSVRHLRPLCRTRAGTLIRAFGET